MAGDPFCWLFTVLSTVTVNSEFRQNWKSQKQILTRKKEKKKSLKTFGFNTCLQCSLFFGY